MKLLGLLLIISVAHGAVNVTEESTTVVSTTATNLEPEKNCDDLEAWCPEIDTSVDCCAPYIQTKCPGSCDTCPAIHCVWDNWAIGSCVTQTELEDGTYCGPGTRTNTRVKLVEESNGGTCDGEYEAILECMDKECPVHCAWNAWIIEDCSLSCGGGTRTLTRTINQTALHGGDECPDRNVTSIVESCNEQECPVQCQWSDWTLGDCSVTCGDGLRINQRFKVTEEMYGGLPCEGGSSMTEACIDRICPEPCCVANGVSDECLGLCVEETTVEERFVSVCDKFADVVEKCTVGSGDTCNCSHLANVTASVGEMSCTNDETRYCDENEECYTTEAFNYGQWDVGCRVVPEA